MLMFLKLDADFSRVWIRGISHMLFATPDHAAVREEFYGSTVWGVLVGANLYALLP
jgi:hypothetical protein